MAEERSACQVKVAEQPAGPLLSTGLGNGRTSGSERNGSPARGPRTLLLRRGENGFGFTLRHFIVYPPESCCMLPGHERTRIDEPMDTIFVKQVRGDSPAAEAGLRTGDRVVSVDGKPTRGEQYAKVVQRIQQAGPWLRLLVVSKEDDILQRYFGETAHNPETNQRPRLRSPEGKRIERRSIVAASPRTRQSWLCSGQLPPNDLEQDRSLEEPPGREPPREPPREPGPRYDAAEEKPRAVRNQHRSPREGRASPTGGSRPGQARDKPDLWYGGSRSESAYSRSNSEQIYDRIREPIYERVRLAEQPRRSLDEQSRQHHRPSHQQAQHHFYRTADLRFPVSHAEPQVPIYRGAARRVASRRASEGSTGSPAIGSFETASYASSDALGSCEAVSRFAGLAGLAGVAGRRDASPRRPIDGPCYDSSPLLLGNGKDEAGIGYGTNGGGGGGIDDSVIMTRLRKSFEQKEEFLRRPSQPIGWFLPEENPETSPVRNGTGSGCGIPREFYARPQKLQKQIWPPADSKLEHRLGVPEGRSYLGRLAAEKPGPSRSVQRARSSAASEEAEFFPDRGEAPASEEYRRQRVAVAASSVPSAEDDARDSGEPKESERREQRARNVSSGSSSASSELPSMDGRTGASSLPSSPGPDRKAPSDKLPLLPQGLQIVSRRAKQFESGKLVSDEDEPTGDRTSLYRSELSRLSNKRSVPNVAVRKREFESKAEAQEPRRAAARESKSLDTGSGLKGNRVIPVGSRRLHCEPPADGRVAPLQDARLPRISSSEETTRPRIRSSSVESWDSRNATGTPPDAEGPRWSPRQPDLERNRAAEDAVYANASAALAGRSERRTERQEDRGGPVPAEDSEPRPGDQVVFRRQKNAQIADEDRATRRVSYLKATWGERLHVDSDLELSDSEPIVHASRSPHKRWRLPLLRNDIASLRRIFEEVTRSASANKNVHRGDASSLAVPEPSPDAAAKDAEQVEREGALHVKFTVLEGKRSSDRSWKQVWGVLRGPILSFYKDRQNQSCPAVGSDGETVSQNVDVRCSLVDIAEDYTKRKHVLRLANPSAEVLLQTEDAASMAVWLRSLHEHAAAEKPSEVARNSTLKQQAVPQTPAPSSASGGGWQSAGSAGGAAPAGSSGNGGQRSSPLPGHKGIKKLTSFRNRSPTGQSPMSKTRKPSQTIETLVSPKSKTWKGRVAKQLRRMHGQTGSPSSAVAQLPPEGATFKVPLELCPPSSFSEYVPLIVEMCTSIVEARGLEVVGIYRVPGNTAAISHLTDTVNKGFENIDLQDPRWSDVNVISSLLKSFFRQLPDSLLTADLYPMFIDADKVEDPQRRMTTIRKLLRDLPEHHFETLKYLMLHLKRIVEHSEVNKMEAKNLAIVFGPTLVRASGSRDNMVTMVTDMSHQCRIVESLLNNVDWFFSDDDLDDLSRLSVNLSLPADAGEIETATSATNHNLLLNNIQKVEGIREVASAKDIVSSIISAANRKIQRRRKGQDETETESGEMEKGKTGKHETESGNGSAHRRSMALNERQCTVSEMVLMHEKKKNRSSERSATASEGLAGAPGSESSRDEARAEDAGAKYLDSRLESLRSIQPATHRSAVSSASESSRLSSETGLSCFDASSTLSSASSDTKRSNDEIAIRTYAGLSATTQERIRRFEQETKAMLQRDQNRQRREAERREEERRRIEMEWQLAKREMESDDLLDDMVDTAVTTAPARSLARIPPLSVAVQQQQQSASLLRRGGRLGAEPAVPVLLPDALSAGIMKRMKTEPAEPTTAPEAASLPAIRYGSLDSLHDTQDAGSRASVSPTAPQRKPVSSDLSDDGSDLLTSLTTTFDRKWRSLINSTTTTTATTATTATTTTTTTTTKTTTTPPEEEAPEDGSLGDDEAPARCPRAERKEERPVETYRDPSLHRTRLDKGEHVRQKNDAPEKDTDSSVAADKDRLGADTPDNDRSALANGRPIDGNRSSGEKPDGEPGTEPSKDGRGTDRDEAASTRNEKREIDAETYSNRLEKFESLTKLEARSRLKRSESLNKRSDSGSSKLRRSESLNKHSAERLSSSPTSGGKLKRSESLNKHSERSDSPSSKLKRSESLSKTEKTESNISKRRQSVRKESATKLKRKNGMPERSIKRRHTVGGTKDFDKVHWLDNKLQAETERVVRNEGRPKKSQLRTSSPDLSTGRFAGLADASFLIEVSFRGPSNVVFNVTNARPQSLPDTSLSSKVFKVPLESHV